MAQTVRPSVALSITLAGPWGLNTKGRNLGKRRGPVGAAE